MLVDETPVVHDTPIASFQAAAPARAPAGTRAGAGRPADPVRVFNVRLAESARDHGEASVLLERMYAWRGYASADTGLFEAGERITLYAETGGELVGTLSLCLDRQGRLPADENFGDRLALLRRQGRRLCEPSRLAIDGGMSKRVFAALIHISCLYARRLHGYTDYVIEVNPRHVAFYRRMLGFADLGGERACSRVGAPAVLLRLPLEYMAAQIRRWGGSARPDVAERSFYPYFFGPDDEPHIAHRLEALCRKGRAA